MKTVLLGADHAGFKLKQELKKFLQHQGYKVVDVGAHELDPTDDYPRYAYAAAKAVAQGKARRGRHFNPARAAKLKGCPQAAFLFV